MLLWFFSIIDFWVQWLSTFWVKFCIVNYGIHKTTFYKELLELKIISQVKLYEIYFFLKILPASFNVK
jgi:hypothetical protein